MESNGGFIVGKPGKIFSKMCDIQAAISAIGKDQYNQGQRFNFRGIDQMYNELHSVLAEHRVFTLPEVLEQTREERQNRSGGVLIYSVMKIRYSFYADDGSYVSATLIGEGMDSGDKASNKGMSIAHKYAFIQAFSIPTKDEIDGEGNKKHKDPDYESHELTPKSTGAKISTNVGGKSPNITGQRTGEKTGNDALTVSRESSQGSGNEELDKAKKRVWFQLLKTFGAPSQQEKDAPDYDERKKQAAQKASDFIKAHTNKTYKELNAMDATIVLAAIQDLELSQDVPM